MDFQVVARRVQCAAKPPLFYREFIPGYANGADTWSVQDSLSFKNVLGWFMLPPQNNSFQLSDGTHEYINEHIAQSSDPMPAASPVLLPYQAVRHCTCNDCVSGAAADRDGGGGWDRSKHWRP